MMKFFPSLLLACALLIAGVIPGLNAQTISSAWEAGGLVRTVHATGNTIYIGGAFTSIYPSTSATGRGIALPRESDKADTSFPFVNNTIWSVIPDGAGGVYIGGTFTEVGGIPRDGLARINADGSLHPWSVSSGGVNALVLRGDTLFVGGNFYSLGGQSRSNLGAVSTTTGTVLPWNPSPNGVVAAMSATGNTLVIGGSFSTVGGSSRTRLAAFDIATGTLATWSPTADNTVHALTAVGSTLYAAGYFTAVSGTTRNYLALIDLETGVLLSQNYNIPMYGTVMNFAHKGDTVFVSGGFSSIGGQSRSHIAALNASTGAVLPWVLANNSVDSYINTMAVHGDTLYAGGSFQVFGGEQRHGLASINISTGTLTSWDPDVNNTVYSMAPTSSGVYAGGLFTCAGHWLSRHRAAAFDITTGEPTEWNPSVNNDVYTLTSSGDTIFIGGSFGLVGGQARSNIAAVNAASGTPLLWNPGANGSVYGLALAGNVLYAGGIFTTIGGQAHSRIAAFSTATGAVLPWNIDANNSVFSIEAGNGTVYAGGDFSTVAGQTRNRAAAIEASTGTVTMWNPNMGSTVEGFAISDSTIFIGGQFFNAGGQVRYRIAAVDATNGALRPWAPLSSSSVNGVLYNNGTVYAGGGFQTMGGKPRECVAALDTNGVVLGWNINADNSIQDFAVAGDNICVVGGFTRLGTTRRNGFALVSRALPAVQLAVASITPTTPAGRQTITLTVETQTAEGHPMAVTQATLVGVSFNHPGLTLFSGSTQATIAADRRSTTLTFSVDNTGFTTITTTLTISTTNASLFSTQQTISVLPPPSADRLVVNSVMPAQPLSDGKLSISVETRNAHGAVMPVTQATLVGLSCIHPDLALVSGSTQAVIAAGASSTTLTICVRNKTVVVVSGSFSIQEAGGVLASTSAMVAIEPPSSQLVVIAAPSQTKHAQPYSIIVGVINSSGIVIPVTQATVVGAAFSHPSLSLISGSTQALIEAGATRAVLTFAVMSTSAETVVTSCVIGTPAAPFTSTQFPLHVEPAASQLAVRSIIPATPHSGQTFAVEITSRNINGTDVPVTTATAVSIAFAHPSLTLAWGSTEAVINAGTSSTTLTLTVYNSAATIVSTALTATASNGFASSTSTLSIIPAPSGYSFPTAGSWIPNAAVQTLLRSGDTVYMGGGFTSFVHPSSVTGTLAVIDPSTGLVSTNFPKVNGVIYTSAPDGEGGLIIGGNFSEVGGVARSSAARINADGTVHAWNPAPGNSVISLCVTNGTVYMGGSFTSVSGQSRGRVAAVSLTSGTVLSWNPTANSSVNALGISGNTIYMGGYFTLVSGTTRNYIAAVDATTGALTSWNPTASAVVDELLINGNTMYVCGSFSSIGGASRSYLAALDITSGTAHAWAPQPSGLVTALYSDGTTLYAGGAFSTMFGQARGGLATFTITTGTLNPLNTGISGGGTISSILPLDGTLYLGGTFINLGGQPRNGLGAINATTGTLLAWDPNVNDAVNSLQPFAGGVAVSGLFTGAGTWVRRQSVAAVNATTGELLQWAPSVNNTVYAMQLKDSTLYLGGAFGTVNSQSRSYAAAVSTTTGALLPWNPSANNTVSSLLFTDSLVYIGGYFTSIGGQSRSRLAAVGATTGVPTSWNPNSIGTVLSMTRSGDSLFVAGDFTAVGGQTRNRLAAIDLVTGEARVWSPNPNSTVRILCVTGATLYVGGDFSTIGGQTRNRFAAFDLTTGNVKSTNISINSSVYSIIQGESAIYIGGAFTSVGGQTRNRIAAIDASGIVLPWNPGASSSVHTLVDYKGMIHTGGAFRTIAGSRNEYYSMISGYVPATRIVVRSVSASSLQNGQSATAILDLKTTTGQPAAAVQPTGILLQFSHPHIKTASGSTQATIAAGSSSATLSFALSNLGTTTCVVQMTAVSTNAILESTSFTLTVLPPAASRLRITDIQPATAQSGEIITATVESRNINNLPMQVTQATIVNLAFAHPSLALTGATQATIAAGSSATTLSFTMHNTGNTTATTQLVLSSADASLLSTQQSISVFAPPASRLAVASVIPASPGNALPFTITAQARNSNNLLMQVTQATVVDISFSHPSISLFSGSTQATIAAGQSSTTLTLALSNSSTTAITTTFTISAQGVLAATVHTITIQACAPVAASIFANGTSELCIGGNITLTASTNASYLWSNGATTQSITVSPIVSTSYSVVVGNAIGCTGSTSISVTVRDLAVAGITANGATAFCKGNSVMLTASTSASYLWSNGATTQSINVSPETTTPYSVTVATIYGCAASTSLVVTVYELPVAVITANGQTTFCKGGNVLLTASSSASYLWSNGATTQSISVSPEATTDYTVAVANSNSCTNSTGITVTVYDYSAAGITPNGTTAFCKGGSVVLTAATGATYTWSNGATTQSISVSPDATTMYTVTVATSYGCSGSTSISVTVYNVPVIGITATGATTICKGATTTLTASTGASYLWSNGATTQSISVSPGATTLYSVVVGTVYGCTGSSGLTITVYELPAPVLTGVTTACINTGGHEYETESVAGNTYEWLVNGGIITSGEGTNRIAVEWISTTGAAVTVVRSTAEGCASSTTLAVVVNPKPVATITPSGPTVFCEGGSVMLSAGTGLASYLWSNGATTQSITVAASGSYSVAVVNDNGCTAMSTSMTVTVHTLPTASITADRTMPICTYDSIELTAGAGASYLWSNGATTQSIVVQPDITTAYTVTVANAQGCAMSTGFTVVVENTAAPAISGAASVCPNTPNNLYQVAMLPGYSYQWNVAGGTITAGQGTNAIEVLWGGQGAAAVEVQRTSPNACVTTASVNITISSSLTPVITSTSPTAFCNGESATLDAGAGYSWYAWSNGATTQTITVTATGMYSATVGDAGGCSGTSAAIEVTVHQVPTATAGQDIAVCASQNVQLEATGGVSYSWAPATGLDNPFIANPVAQPTQTTVYVVTVSNASGCESKDTVVVTVNPIRLDVKVVLEGAFNGTQMNTGLVSNGYLPEVQPFSDAPFSYDGKESITVIPGSVVDWVLLELRSADASSSVIGRRAALLRNSGSIVDLDGVSPVAVALTGTADSNSFYVVVYHRNHLPVMSSSKIQPAQNCTASHNFTTGQQQAYATIATPMKQLATGVYGMVAGDVTRDDVINAPDRVAVRNATGLVGYTDMDVTLDSIVGAADRVATQNNRFRISQVP